MAIYKLLQGMPRRISDYPDAFAGWNLISSFGSIISVVATFLFLHILYVQLVEGNATSRYPWLTPQFYSDSLQTILNRNYNSLEWCLTSPPKPHAFVSLPLQSKASFISTLLSRHFTPKKVTILNTVFILSWIIRLFFKQFDIILINSDVLFSISSFTTIFSSSFLRAYLENLVGDVSWSSVYYFITSSNKEKWGVISNFLEVLKSSKGNGGGGLIKAEVSTSKVSPDPIELTSNKMESSSANTGSSSANTGPVSGSANTGPVSGSGNTGPSWTEQHLAARENPNITARISYDALPKDIPPTQDNRVPSNSSVWRDLRARYGPGHDEYEEGYIIAATPIISPNDTGYKFNYKEAYAYKQIPEAKNFLNTLLEQVTDAHDDAKASRSGYNKNSSIKDPHALHQYLACREDFQRRLSIYIPSQK